MRKKDFRTTNPKLSFESTFEDNDITKFKNDLEDISAMIDIKSERDMIAEREKDVIQSLNEVNEAYNEAEQLGVDLIQDPFLTRYLPPDPDPNSPEDIAGHISQEGHILPEELTIVQSLSEELTQLKRSLPNMMATTAGGGEVLLKYMDDVDASARTDGYFFKYRASDGKFIGSASTVSDEQIQDVIGAMVTSNTESGITVAYQDGDGTLDFTIGTLNQDTTGNAATATALETARTIHGVSFDGTANIDLTEVVQDTVGAMFSSNTETGIAVSYEDGDGTIDLVVGTLNQDTTGNADTATLATTVTVTDSTANTNFPVVFHNESNALLDDTGALRYNPSTGELLVPKLTVAGTTTTVDTVTMQASNAIIFEGATADAHETTLTVTDPTADRTITLPNVTGTVALTSSDITGNAATATALETARTIGGTSFDGTANIAVALAATATALASARTIHGVSFDGTANIDLTEVVQDTVGAMFSSNTETGITVSYEDGDGTIDLVVGTLNQDTTGSAATLTTARSIAMSGDVVWSVSFDGSAAVTAAGTIQSGAVETGMIAADAITAAKIADDVINSEHYVDGSIDTAHIADSQITSAKIANGTIVAADLANDAITTDKITDANVSTAKIANDAITGAKIADDSINSEHYVDGSIDTAHIADDAVTAAKLAAGNIVSSHLASNAVETSNINADAVTGAKIADDAINSEHYVDGSIDTAHIADCLLYTSDAADE